MIGSIDVDRLEQAPREQSPLSHGKKSCCGGRPCWVGFPVPFSFLFSLFPFLFSPPACGQLLSLPPRGQVSTIVSMKDNAAAPLPVIARAIPPLKNQYNQ